jgi:hypothetical protein
MFIVCVKDNKKITRKVYSVKEEDGFTLFLVFMHEKWIWSPSDQYIPY